MVLRRRMVISLRALRWNRSEWNISHRLILPVVRIRVQLFDLASAYRTLVWIELLGVCTLYDVLRVFLV